MDRLTIQEQGQLVMALLKRFHPDAARTLGELPTEGEIALLARWDSRRGTPCAAEAAPGERGNVDRKRLLQIIKQGLDFLGIPKKLSRVELQYSTTVDGWVIQTHLDFGGRFSDVAYHHDLGEASAPPCARFISVLSWLGVVGGGTKWKVFSEDEAIATATILGRICQHFLEAVPGLVSGLGTHFQDHPVRGVRRLPDLK